MKCRAWKTCKLRDEDSATCLNGGTYYEGGGLPGCLRRWMEQKKRVF